MSAQENRCSLHSMSPSLMKAMAEELKGTKVSGATIHLTIENPLSRELAERIVRERSKEIGLAQRGCRDEGHPTCPRSRK
jgi:uncharacterized protein YdhG (YjbR/CyaY superfamily)